MDNNCFIVYFNMIFLIAYISLFYEIIYLALLGNLHVEKTSGIRICFYIHLPASWHMILYFMHFFYFLKINTLVYMLQSVRACLYHRVLICTTLSIFKIFKLVTFMLVQYAHTTRLNYFSLNVFRITCCAIQLIYYNCSFPTTTTTFSLHW